MVTTMRVEMTMKGEGEKIGFEDEPDEWVNEEWLLGLNWGFAMEMEIEGRSKS